MTLPNPSHASRRRDDNMSEELRRQVIGQAMRDARKRQKFTLRELAQRMGVSAPFLSDMERGNRDYSLKWQQKAIVEMALR